MSDAFKLLQERGFIRQCTDPEGVAEHLAKGPQAFYIGYDPTADSLHAGSLVPIMAMAHLQRLGHRPIAVIGGGTTMVGDPSGKTEMRRMMSRDEIQSNGRKILAQLGRYLDFDEGRALFLDNADWLMRLNYVEFLRDIGRHFRVNEMIKVEAYRLRLEREDGLSFIEFNYQLLQAFDFLHLFKECGCSVQMGGDDQWGNIVAGVDLIRRMTGKTAYGATFPLLTTASGEKMGKTARGAVWLDAEKFSPYEFYQYWMNTDDRDVERFLRFFTFLPPERIRGICREGGEALKPAKEALAFETTKLLHGEAEATQAEKASRAAFGGAGEDYSAMPTTTLPADRLAQGVAVVDLFVETGLTTSKGEARRLIKQGGAYVNGHPIDDTEAVLHANDAENGALMLRFGKKKFHRVVVE